MFQKTGFKWFRHVSKLYHTFLVPQSNPVVLELEVPFHVIVPMLRNPGSVIAEQAQIPSRGRSIPYGENEFRQCLVIEAMLVIACPRNLTHTDSYNFWLKSKALRTSVQLVVCSHLSYRGSMAVHRFHASHVDFL